MAKIGVFFSAGYEEIEALTVVDLCRRAGIEVTMVSVDETAAVTGSHQITVQMDQLLSETDFDAFDLLVLPGGMPGLKIFYEVKTHEKQKSSAAQPASGHSDAVGPAGWLLQ